MYIKFLGSDTRKLLPSLGVLILLGTLIWLGARLFSHRLLPLLGSILFLICLAAFVWCAVLLNRNKKRRPSFKLVVFSFLVIFIVLGFAGVQPVAYYKDYTQYYVVQGIKNFWGSLRVENNAVSPPVADSSPYKTEPTVPYTSLPTIPPPTQMPTSQQPIYPERVSIVSSVPKAELLNERSTKITATLKFVEGTLPGHYQFTLMSGNEDLGTKKLDWYRGRELVSLDWTVVAGSNAFYRLTQGDFPSDIFIVSTSYIGFRSITSGVISSPTALEQDICIKINELRVNGGLTALTWRQNLYDLAVNRVKEIGEEGQLFSSNLNSQYFEMAYEAPNSATANELINYWMGNQQYRDIINNPATKALAVRTDIYSNNKSYAVAIFTTD